jgi:hypothetical protein
VSGLIVIGQSFGNDLQYFRRAHGGGCATILGVSKEAPMANARGLIAVDKMGTKVLFLNPVTYETEVVLDGFDKTVHELLVMPDISRAYVPIFGDGIPRPQSQSAALAVRVRPREARPAHHHRSAALYRPAYLKLAPDGLIYITCENSAKVVAIDPKTNTVVGAIDSGSTNGHRLIISPTGSAFTPRTRRTAPFR